MRRRPTPLLLAGSLILVAAPAFAYLDPGTGSMILQMLIAGSLVALFYIRTAWDKTRGFFARIFSRDTNDTKLGADEPQRAEAEGPEREADEPAG
ncbi:MAG: hypothetical protein F4Y86_02255 [Gammaproteobacteria bacterium]|nr:hypothetical protein [Gammaproteobacteria bacterium]